VLSTIIIRLRQESRLKIAATAMMLASVVSNARLAKSKVRSTGAEQRACFRALKLACVSVVHAKRAVGLKRRTSEHDVGISHSMIDCILRGSTDTPVCERRLPRKPSSVRLNSHFELLE
jgi:hypothetical protein